MRDRAKIKGGDAASSKVQVGKHHDDAGKTPVHQSNFFVTSYLLPYSYLVLWPTLFSRILY